MVAGGVLDGQDGTLDRREGEDHGRDDPGALFPASRAAREVERHRGAGEQREHGDRHG